MPKFEECIQRLENIVRELEQGEVPQKIMGAFAAQLRKLAQAARLAIQGTNLRAALGSS